MSKYMHATFLVCIMLLVHLFSKADIWYWITNLFALSRKVYFSNSQYSLVAW